LAHFRGLAFDSSGKLLATADLCNEPDCGCFGGTHHALVEVDPLTGEVREEIGDVRDASGSPIVMVSLSAKPGADLLYGFGGAGTEYPAYLKLWSVEPSTGVAFLIGSPAGCPEIGCRRSGSLGVWFSGLAFGPDGTLHATLASLGQNLLTLDADTGDLISSQPIDRNVYGAAPLAVRSDGTLFVHSATVKIRLPKPCLRCPPSDPWFEIFPCYVATIDESTGVVTEVATGVATPLGFSPTDLTFSPVALMSMNLALRPAHPPTPTPLPSPAHVPVPLPAPERLAAAPRAPPRAALPPWPTSPSAGA